MGTLLLALPGRDRLFSGDAGCDWALAASPPQDGYVFRLQVAYHREPLILKEVVTPEGLLKYQETEESQRLEVETQQLPFLTSSLHG